MCDYCSFLNAAYSYVTLIIKYDTPVCEFCRQSALIPLFRTGLAWWREML